MTDKLGQTEMIGEEKQLKRKQSLEASVTLGLGYGKKKKQYVEAFYSAVWPMLEDVRWTTVSEIIDFLGISIYSLLNRRER